MQHIETVTVGSGGAASITFSAIPDTFTDLLLVVSARDSDTGGAVIFVRPNGSTANGTTRWLRGSGSAVASNTETSIIARSNSGDRTANTFGSCSVYIANYTSSSYKSFSLEGVEENNATGAFMDIGAGLWSVTDSITSLRIDPGVANFVQYSSASLYGITAGSDGIVSVS